MRLAMTMIYSQATIGTRTKIKFTEVGSVLGKAKPD